MIALDSAGGQGRDASSEDQGCGVVIFDTKLQVLTSEITAHQRMSRFKT